MAAALAAGEADEAGEAGLDALPCRRRLLSGASSSSSSSPPAGGGAASASTSSARLARPRFCLAGCFAAGLGRRSASGRYSSNSSPSLMKSYSQAG